jgi:acetyl-CoA C-acetyltransferase
MPFAGGPFNSFSLEGVARMVEVLRGGERSDGSERRIGLVSNLSGIFAKQACALFSNLPNADGYRYEDVTAAVAARDLPLPLDGDYVGPATIVGYTVVFGGGCPHTLSRSVTRPRAGAPSCAARTRGYSSQ